MENRDNIIYHLNGYLPRKMSDFASPQLVFLEDTFEDQLVDSLHGHYNALNNHYSSKICLFIGISLEDRTLKHMLRLNAKKCFGHFHYVIQHMPNLDHEKNENFQTHKASETKANFDTYNLFMMYLTSEEINTLMEMLQLGFDDFNAICNKIKKAMKFFIMGSVAAGKSTVVSQFKCFKTYDEWLEDMPDGMDKAPRDLDKKNEKKIDNWIAEQIWRKNANIDLTTKSNLPCILIIDRTPIDAFAFFSNDINISDGNENEEEKSKRTKQLDLLWKKKAILHLSKKGADQSLVGGKIIFLQGEVHEMVKRAKQKFRGHKKNDLQIQQNEILHLIKGARHKYKDKSVYIINVTNKNIEQVAKEVARVIYFEEYAEVNFQNILDSIAKKGEPFMKNKIYLAAPLFSEAEKTFNKQLKQKLLIDFDVYLPQEDGMLIVDLVKEGISFFHASRMIFNTDISAINDSDILLIVLDGRAVDEGAAVELGFAYSKGKRCIGYSTDPRCLLPDGQNPMISC